MTGSKDFIDIDPKGILYPKIPLDPKFEGILGVDFIIEKPKLVRYTNATIGNEYWIDNENYTDDENEDINCAFKENYIDIGNTRVDLDKFFRHSKFFGPSKYKTKIDSIKQILLINDSILRINTLMDYIYENYNDAAEIIYKDKMEIINESFFQLTFYKKSDLLDLMKITNRIRFDEFVTQLIKILPSSDNLEENEINQNKIINCKRDIVRLIAETLDNNFFTL